MHQGGAMPIEDFIITVFCYVVEYFQEVSKGQKLRTRGFRPKLDDTEVITMELVGEFMGMDCDKRIWEYFRSHWLHLFPHLSSRTAFVKQAANLWAIKQKMQERIAEELNAKNDMIHMIDGFPIQVCKFARAHFRTVFKSEASYGYCASKKETYCGFKGNLLINSWGIVTGLTLTKANIDERESMRDIIGNIHGLLIGDMGFIGTELKLELADEMNINLETSLRANMKDERSKDYTKWLVSTRRLVETVIGQLVERFNIAKVRARDIWHLTARIARKTLAHTIAALINIKLGRSPLQFEGLING